MKRPFFACGLVAAAILAAPSKGLANPEPVSLYSARTAGMGGQAIAFVDDDTALHHNPAGLEHIDRFSLTAVGTSLLVRYRVPFAGPSSEISSPIIYAPLVYLGGAGRITDRLTLGLGLYIQTGFGGGFNGISRIDDYYPVSYRPNSPPGTPLTDRDGNVILDANGNPVTTAYTAVDQTVTLFVAELAVPVAVSVTEDFRLGIAFRLPYGRQDTSAFQEILPGQWQPVHQSVAGIGTPGILFGFQWDVRDDLTLAAVYRSPTRITMEGDTTLRFADPRSFDPVTLEPTNAPTVVPTSTAWRTPHMIRLGLAYWTLHRRLMISTEFRVQLHHRSNRDQTFVLDSDAARLVGLETFTVPFNWRNVYAGSAGAEYLITRRWPFRFGFSVANSATPVTTLSPFTPPPGLQWAFAFGTGYRFDHVHVDLGYSLGTGRPNLVASRNPTYCDRDARVKGGCDGIYQLDAHHIAVSLTYQR